MSEPTRLLTFYRWTYRSADSLCWVLFLVPVLGAPLWLCVVSVVLVLALALLVTYAPRDHEGARGV